MLQLLFLVIFSSQPLEIFKHGWKVGLEIEKGTHNRCIMALEDI
jgi:hypothetical protein